MADVGWDWGEGHTSHRRGMTSRQLIHDTEGDVMATPGGVVARVKDTYIVGMRLPWSHASSIPALR